MKLKMLLSRKHPMFICQNSICKPLKILSLFQKLTDPERLMAMQRTKNVLNNLENEKQTWRVGGGVEKGELTQSTHLWNYHNENSLCH
jgi:hypothetical protein